VFTLDPNTGRLQGYQFNVGSNSDTGTASWNANGSLYQLAINDTIPGTQDTQTCTYAHDDLARVASVNCLNGSTNKWNQTFNYDAFGNIAKNTNGPGNSFQAGYSSSSNWITSLPGITPTTDADGRMTYDGTHTYGWDAESKMVSVDTTTVTYDALGRMVEKNVSGTYTQIVYGPQGGKFAVMNGQTLVQAFIPLPTGAKAVYTSAGLAFYRHSDHLGSSRLATTPSRTLYSSTAYAPFGEAYNQAGTTDVSFTGQDQDTVAGMHDFLDRRFMPVQGRWLSPDPMGLAAVDPTSPQSWNRYAYVVNNPLAMIDPFGDDGCYGNNAPFPVHCNIGVGDPMVLAGLWGDGFAVMQVPAGEIPLWGWVANKPNSGVQPPSDPLADSITVNAYWGQIGAVSLNAVGLMPACALFCGSNGNDVFNGVYPKQPPNDTVGPAPKPPAITREQAKELCSVAVQLRNNGSGPLNGFSGDPNYSVDQGTTVVGPPPLNPNGASAGSAAQGAAGAVSMIVGKAADMQTCMGFYDNN